MAASAAPTITAVTPATGPAAGGTEVTIRGTDFSTCIICSPPAPPAVFFGATPAASVTLVNDTTIVAITPPHPAGTTDVTVDQFDGSATATQAFAFVGDFTTSLEPVLIPIFGPPVHGQFGSEFRTTVVASHRGGSGRAFLFGLDTSCFLLTPVLGVEDPRLIEPNGTTYDLFTDCATWPAKLFYLSQANADDITFNARVRDVSRSGLSHGTQIPIVRRNDFKQESIVLLNVPLDSRFRNALRIYSLDEANVQVTIDGVEHEVSLTPGRDRFEPSYAMFTNFPLPESDGTSMARVTVTPLTPLTSPPSPTPRIWAFVSITNNTTQEITIVSPD